MLFIRVHHQVSGHSGSVYRQGNMPSASESLNQPISAGTLRCRKSRELLRADSERYERYKEKDRERKRLVREKQAADMTYESIEQRRKMEREAKRRQRAKKKLAAANKENEPENGISSII